MKDERIAIDKKNPFANCKLGREPYANILSSIVDSYAKGFVLAINGEWGVGKTTFVKMWMQKLKNEGHKTIYFNAWENDFVLEPMVGILGELKSLITSDPEKRFDSILKGFAKFSNKIIPASLKFVAKSIGLGGIADVIEKGGEAMAAFFENEISNYDQKKESLQSLRNDLCNLVAQNNGGKPVVFIIDELDRCRPDYAVEVLEKVKHFFSVQGIIFVLSIDKKQLGNSIRGFYGSENINADEYLRRFIDIEYSLPEPSIKDFCEYLYDYFTLNEFFENEWRCTYDTFKDDSLLFKRISVILSTEKHLTLRKIEKLFAYTRLVLKTFRVEGCVLPEVVFMLIYLKYYENDLYNAIKRNKLNIHDIVNQINSIFTISLKDKEQYEYRTLIFAMAKLIYCYNNSYRGTGYYQSLFSRENEELSFDTGEIDKNFLYLALEHCDQKYTRFELSTKSLIQKIDLLESLKQ